MDHCLGLMESQGPFDGVLGFSQGANMATMLAGIAEYERPGLLKFVVCMCGVESGWGDQLPELIGLPASPRITIPSLHIQAKEDGYFKMTQQLTALYAAPEVTVHTGDHRPFPTDVKEAKALCRTIEAFITKIVPSK